MSGLSTAHKSAVSKATVRERGVGRDSVLQAGGLLALFETKGYTLEVGGKTPRFQLFPWGNPSSLPTLSLGLQGLI